MTIQDTIMAKVKELPEPLAQEVNDFIDFLLLKQDNSRTESEPFLTEGRDLAGLGMDDYLSNLEDYEERLARGEIKWRE